MKEAENMYLIKSFGAVLFKDVNENISTYSLLLKGGYYDNDTKHFVGLSEAMGYLSYSRMVRNQSVNVTAFGMVQKISEHSEAMSDKAISRTADDAEKIGLEYLNQCVEYLKFIEKLECDNVVIKRRKFKTIGD